MPESLVFIGGLRIPPQETSHTTDFFTSNRVPFMRHSGRTFLLRAEVLFCFSYFCPLQVADFEGNLIQGTTDNSHGRQEFCMTIPLYYLGSNLNRFQIQFFTYILFHEWIDIGVSPYSARQFTNRHCFTGMFQTFYIPFYFRHPEAKLQAEGRRFPMDTMGAADHRCVFELNSPAPQNVVQFLKIFQEDVARLLHHIAQGRILNICGGQTQMNILSRFWTYLFPYSGYKGDNIVVGFRFDFMNSFHFEVALFPNNSGCFLRNYTQLSLCFRG